MAKPFNADLAKRLGINLAAARKKTGLTQGELSALTAIDTVTLSRYEHGVNSPSLPTLEILARALHTTMGALLGDQLPSDPDEITQLRGLLQPLSPSDREHLLLIAKLISRRCVSMSGK